jgi:hypothetical protein
MPHSIFWYRGTKTVDFCSIPGMAGDRRALKRDHLIVQPFFCASNPLQRAGLGHGLNRLWLTALRSRVFSGREFIRRAPLSTRAWSLYRLSIKLAARQMPITGITGVKLNGRDL